MFQAVKPACVSQRYENENHLIPAYTNLGLGLSYLASPVLEDSGLVWELATLVCCLPFSRVGGLVTTWALIAVSSFRQLPRPALGPILETALSATRLIPIRSHLALW